MPHITGLPGHGNWNLLDAFNHPGSDVPIIQTMHEQAAVHIANAHYRATGRGLHLYWAGRGEHDHGVGAADLPERLPIGRPRGDAKVIEAAIERLLRADRPCIAAGGGTIASDASPILKWLVERLGIPVVFT